MLRADIGQYVAGMGKAAGSTAALGNSVDATTGKATRGLGGLGTAGMAAGGLLAAGLGLAVSKSMEFETAMSAVQAATGATAATLDDLRQAAMEAGAATQYSATEAATAITEMSKAGVSAADIMGGGLDGALALAAAGQLAVADAAEIASVAMTQFNLSGEDLPHVADLLAAGAGKAMGSVDDLGQALNQAGLVASAAGLNIEETTGGLAAFASAGLVGSDAGTSFKTMLQALQAPTGKSSELMAELGLNMYDSQGNMLGLAEMAGQLQSQLGGLTEEQRNAALAQIFGSDAVRAANVLYREGSTGIQSWTAAVNDQGYASEQAAALTDNLKGDLERLGGAFDTLMISLGSGTQGPLREVVQMFTGFLDGVGGLISWFSELPGPVKATAGALGALAILNGPLSGVLSTVKGFAGNLFGGVAGTTSAFGEALGYARQNGDGLGTVLRSVGGYAGGQLKAGLGGIVSLFGGPWGIALAGAAAGVSYITSTMEDADRQTQDWTQSILNGTTAADGLNEAYLAQYGGEKPDWLQQQSELLGFTSSLEDAEAGARELYDAMDPLAQAQQNVTYDTNRLVEAIDKFGENSPEAQQAAELLAESNARLAGRQDAVTAATEAADAALAESNGTLAAATEETISYSDAMGDAQTELDELIAGLAILTGTQVSLQQAQNDVQSAVMDATEAFDEQGGAVLGADGMLNSYSRNGIEAYDRMVAMAEANNTLIGTMEQQGATTEEVIAKDASLRQSFIDTAIEMGLSEDAARTYADQIYGIPEDRTTRIEANTDTAASRIAGIAAAVFGLPDGTVDVNANTDPAEQALQDFLRAKANLGLTVSGFLGFGGPGRANGGPITGPGTGRSDSILGVDAFTGMPTSYVSNGEFVTNQREYQRNRPLVEAINAGAVPAGINPADLRFLAAGGPVLGTKTIDVGMSLAGVTTALAAAASDAPVAAGPAGSGSIGGTWSSIYNVVKAAIPAARQNSTFRRGDPGYHGKNKAVDFGYGSGPGGAGSAGLASINRFLYDNYGSKLAELIYDGIGDDRPDIKNGRPHTYNAATRAQHANHVHAANYRDGGLIGMPQYKQGTPFVPNDGPAYLHKGEAVVPAYANGGMVRAEDGSMVSSSFYDNLGQGIYKAANGELARASNWRDWQQNAAGKWYDPSSREFSGASSSAASGSSASQAFPDGMRITGSVQFDPSRGMIQFVDARVFNGASEMTRIATGRGF